MAKKDDSMEKDERRKALKQLSAVSSVGVLSIFGAQRVVASSHLSMTVCDTGSDDADGFSVIYDGEEFSLIQGDEAENSADLIMYLDVDSGNPNTFDWENGEGTNHSNGIGSNWTGISTTAHTGTPGEYESDIPEGTYTAIYQRAGMKGQTVVTFKVLEDGGCMTISNLSASVVL